MSKRLLLLLLASATACTQSDIGQGGRSNPPAATPEPNPTPQATRPAASAPEMVGIWEVTTPPGEAEFITIGPEGNAIRSAQGRADMNGRWSRQDDSVIVVWEDRSTDVLTPNNGFLDRASYPADSNLTQEPTKRSKLSRLAKRAPSKEKATSWAEGLLKEHCTTH